MRGSRMTKNEYNELIANLAGMFCVAGRDKVYSTISRLTFKLLYRLY